MSQARSSPHNVRPLVARDIDAAARILARAFADDPMWVYIEPDADRRAADLAYITACDVRLALLHDAAYVTQDASGVAAWVPPSPPDVDPDGTRTGFAEEEQRLGAPAYERLRAYMDHLRPLMPAQPYWYLMLIGVDPAAQRRGIGSALLAPVLARADRERTPCYLETERPENVLFYRTHGFEVSDEGDFRGLRYWTMLRPRAG